MDIERADGALARAKEGAARELGRRILEGWADGSEDEAIAHAAAALTPEDERLCLAFCLDFPGLLERALRRPDLEGRGAMAAIQAAIGEEIREHLAAAARGMSEDPWFLAQAMAAANERPELLDTWFFRGRDLASDFSRIEAREIGGAAGEGDGLPSGKRKSL